MTSHDDLITRFKLDDQYSGPAQKILGVTQRLHGALGSFSKGLAGSVSNAFSAVGRSITSALSNPLSTLLGLMTGGVIAAFVHQSLEVASTFDSIERSFFGVLGSWDKVRGMMDYLKAYTIPSNYGLEPLANAAALLARNRIDVSTYLPIIEMLALASGRGGEEPLLDAARLLMRLKGGDIAAAFSAQEGIGRFGIGKDAIAEQGGKFDKSGGFVGSVSEAFDVIAKTVKAKLGSIKDAMAGSIEATFSNAATAAQMALADIGKVFYTAFAPALNAISQLLVNLTKNGDIKRWAEQLSGFLKGDPKDSFLVKSAVIFVATMKEIPNLWEVIKLGFMIVATHVTNLFNTVIEGLNRALKIYNAIAFVLPGVDPVKLIDKFDNPFSGKEIAGQGLAALNATRGGKSPVELITQTAGEIMDGLSKSLNAAQEGLPEAPFTGGEELAQMQKQTEYDRQIAQNTKKLTENLDSLLMGGGAFTERTLNAYNLSRMTGGGGAVSEARDYFMRGFEALERGMQGMLVDYNRQGHFRPS